jgi:hypothetical protein
MTKKLPPEKLVTQRVKDDIERTLLVADTINGKKPIGGTLGKRQQKGAIDTTKEFDQFLKDASFLINKYSSGETSFTIDRLKTSVAELRKQQGGKK